MSKIIGIDISKQTFDACFFKNKKKIHHTLENNAKGFRGLLKEVDKEDWVVMEASGSYYLALANYFWKKGIKVCVVNPLIIKRYSQSRLVRAKTDKKDAQVIAEYGAQYELKEWIPESKASIDLRQMHSTIELLKKEIRQLKNQEEAFESSKELRSFLKRCFRKATKELMKVLKELEDKQQELAKEHYEETLERLQSIPGIGFKTAIMLAVITDNFRKFENYKQLIAYVGLSPRIYQSGTSVKGRGHICKMGKSQVRKLLYMCSWTAKKYNPGCIAMYERLKAKGKPEKVIKIALANKLLKQAFAIAKNKSFFQADFSSQKLVS